jgi:hypothetical protein
LSETLTEERRLRAFENRVLRGIFRSKRGVKIGWRKFHNGEFHNFYSSPNMFIMIRRMKWRGM